MLVRIIIALHVNNSFCKYVKENNHKNIPKNYIQEKIRFGKYFNVNNKVFIFPLFSHDTLIWKATYYHFDFEILHFFWHKIYSLIMFYYMIWVRHGPAYNYLINSLQQVHASYLTAWVIFLVYRVGFNCRINNCKLSPFLSWYWNLKLRPLSYFIQSLYLFELNFQGVFL